MSPQQLPFELSDKELGQLDSLIDGKPITAKSGSRFDVIDPGNGKVWASCPDCREPDVDAAVQSSHAAFLTLSKWTPRQRAQTLLKWHQLIIAARDDLAKILVHETGKPLAEAYGEIDYATTFTWWFVGEAERVHGSSIVASTPGRRGVTIKQPLGVCVGLVPWNFPIALSLRKAGAALAAGCTMVVKPSPETPISAIAVAVLAQRAGFPPGALNVLTTSLEGTPGLAKELCLHPLVKKVTFTGSTRVGKIISPLCASQLKKCTMELGGNCPFIVFDDADLDHALAQLMALKWRHAGQACVTANRVYIHRGVYDKFVEMVLQGSSKLKMGHGMAEGATLGPVTTPQSLDRAEQMVEDAIAKGAKTITGSGKRAQPDDATSGGYFMAPTILKDVTDDMRMSQEEIFAPVLGLSVFDSEDEVVKRANNTSMGLTSYVFTKNVDRLWRMFERLEAGMIGLVRHPAHYLINARSNILNRTPAITRRLKFPSVASRKAVLERRVARMLRLRSS